MPFVLVKRVGWDGTSYFISLEDLLTVIPHLKVGDYLNLCIIEIRNERNELVKRFKPINRQTLKVSQGYDPNSRIFIPALTISSSEATKLNLGLHYTIALLILTHNWRPLFPYEWRYAGPNAQEIVRSLERIETTLLTITQPSLQETVTYLLEAVELEKEGRIEEARTKLRNSLETLSKIREKIKPVAGKECEDLGKRLENLIKGIKGFVDYGGPHLGPAPKPTTDMVFSMVAELVKMLSKNISEGNLAIAGEN